MAEGYRYRMVQGRVEAKRAGAEDDPARLLAAMKAVARFSRNEW